MDPYALKMLNAERRARRAVILVTSLNDGRDRVVKEGDQVAGELGRVAREAFLSGQSKSAEIDGKPYFINVHLPPPRLVIIGAVHISQALAPMAELAGYDIEIIDPRTAFATPERFERFKLSAVWPDEALAERPLDPYSALAALTHDPKIDDAPIRAALEAGCFYVGALGSRKTHARRVERLQEAGVADADIDRIRAPIGLDIAAKNPAEIAVAVLAELIEAFHRRQTAGRPPDDPS